MAARAVRAVAALAALLDSSGCNVAQAPQSSLEIGVVTPTTHLDPARGDDPGTSIVARFAFQTLPQVSKRIVRGPDPRSWGFILKPGLRFSDGTPLDAEAVDTNVARWKSDPTTFTAFVGASARIEPSGYYISTRTPVANLPELLSDPHFSLGSPRAFANASAFDRKPVGSGPYEVAEFVPGRYTLLVPRADGAASRASARYASIRIDEIPDPHTSILSLDKDDVQIVYGFPQRYLDEARSDRMYPVREARTGLWCAFAVGLVKSERQCPPGASLAAPTAETNAP